MTPDEIAGVKITPDEVVGAGMFLVGHGLEVGAGVMLPGVGAFMGGVGLMLPRGAMFQSSFMLLIGGLPNNPRIKLIIGSK